MGNYYTPSAKFAKCLKFWKGKGGNECAYEKCEGLIKVKKKKKQTNRWHFLKKCHIFFY